MSKLKIDENGDRFWYNENDELHREDGPAVEFSNGIKYWYINGELHRVDGPAVEDNNGYKEWWISGKQIIEEEFNKIVNNF